MNIIKDIGGVTKFHISVPNCGFSGTKRMKINQGKKIVVSVIDLIPFVFVITKVGTNKMMNELINDIDLFLSADVEDVKRAIDTNIAAAHIFTNKVSLSERKELRIAFDADAVIFSDESEVTYKKKGLKKYLLEVIQLKYNGC